MFESGSNTVFGKLDTSGRKILRVLEKELSIQLLADHNVSQSQTSGMHMERSRGKSKLSASPLSLQLFAILYGPSTLFEAVGSFAAKCRLYLQHPRHCDKNVPYRNPHCLSPESGCIGTTFDLGPFTPSGLDVFTNPIDLFADAAEQDMLTEAYAPRSLVTELYKHQKQALTFMMQRERGWAMDGHHKDIWREEHDSHDRSVYQNMISGMKQMARPSQFRGGLLLDAPGLGKSLSMIALISSDTANEAQNVQEHASSSTTLLVVPKTCEL